MLHTDVTVVAVRKKVGRIITQKHEKTREKRWDKIFVLINELSFLTQSVN